MKKLLILTLAALLSAGFAIANSTKPHITSIPVEKAASPSLATLSQVARENQELHLQLEALQNQIDELNSQISYQQVMFSMLSSVDNQQLADFREESKATVSYISTMTQVLAIVKTADFQDQVAEKQAQIDYQRTMEKVLGHMRNVAVR